MGLQLDATVTNVSLEFNWSCGGRHANGRASSAKGKDEEEVEEKDTYQRGRNGIQVGEKRSATLRIRWWEGQETEDVEAHAVNGQGRGGLQACVRDERDEGSKLERRLYVYCVFYASYMASSSH